MMSASMQTRWRNSCTSSKANGAAKVLSELTMTFSLLKDIASKFWRSRSTWVAAAGNSQSSRKVTKTRYPTLEILKVEYGGKFGGFTV